VKRKRYSNLCHIIFHLIVGLIIGLCKLLNAGKDPGGCILTSLLGIGARHWAFLGQALGSIAWSASGGSSEPHWAMLILWIYG